LLLLLLLLTTTEHTAEYIAQQVAETARLSVLCGAGQNACQVAKIKSTLIFGAAQYTHDNRSQDRHQLHNLAHTETRAFSNLFSRNFLPVAQHVSEDPHPVGCTGRLIVAPGHHTAYHTEEIVEHTAIVVAVKRSTE